MRTALVTGGAGFIGSHLAEHLLGGGWRVLVVDDLSTGALRNLEAIADDARLSCRVGSVLQRELMEELVDAADVVFHLAAAVGVRLIVDRPVRTLETNIRTTEVVLELAAARGLPVFFASTSEVYGKLEKDRFREDSDVVLGPTTRARWAYAGSKMVDEFLCQAYFRERGLPTVVGRLFNTIGPRQSGRYGMVVPRFVRQALRNRPITVYGDGLQARSFTWVGDVVRACAALMELPAAHGEVFNIGHDREISILALARLVREMTGSRSEIRLVPYDEAYAVGFEDMQRRLPDLTKIQDAIGYRPTLQLPQMLERVIADVERELRA